MSDNSCPLHIQNKELEEYLNKNLLPLVANEDIVKKEFDNLSDNVKCKIKGGSKIKRKHGGNKKFIIIVTTITSIIVASIMGGEVALSFCMRFISEDLQKSIMKLLYMEVQCTNIFDVGMAQLFSDEDNSCAARATLMHNAIIKFMTVVGISGPTMLYGVYNLSSTVYKKVNDYLSSSSSQSPSYDGGRKSKSRKSSKSKSRKSSKSKSRKSSKSKSRKSSK